MFDGEELTEENKDMGGIYQIRNIVNDKIYVGSAVCLRKRWNDHKSGFKKQNHHSHHLINSCNKYGLDSFKFTILEIVENKENLTKEEQRWIDFLLPEYNKRKIAESNLGFKFSLKIREKMSIDRKGKLTGKDHYFYGRKLSSEVRKKMSESRMGKKNHFFGKKHSQETRRKISEINGDGKFLGENNPNSKLNWKKVRKIRELYNGGRTYKELSCLFNISKGTIADIVTSRTWKTKEYIHTKPPLSERLKRGESSLHAKLKEANVLEIRNKYIDGVSINTLTKEYNVSRSCIQNIIKRETWNHI